MREPRWLSGAYSTSPRLKSRSGTGPSVASAAIECWRGTITELLEPIEAMSQTITGSRGALREARVTWIDGTQTFVKKIDRLRSVLEDRPGTDVLSIRAEIRSEDQTQAGVLTARRVIPGITVTVTSPDEEAAISAARIVFHRMMIGYVDRLGGHRAPVVMASGLSPMLLLSTLFGGADLPIWLKLTIACVAFAGIFAVINVMYDALQVSEGLHILSQDRASSRIVWKKRIASAYSHKRVRLVLGIAGSLLLGIIGNKIADAIHWP